MIMNDIKQNYGENTTCDFKEAVERKSPKSWLKSVSAFANTVGGVLVFGMTDDGLLTKRACCSPTNVRTAIPVSIAPVGTVWKKMKPSILANTKATCLHCWMLACNL